MTINTGEQRMTDLTQNLDQASVDLNDEIEIYELLDRIERMGGGFEQCLAMAFRKADLQNRRLIFSTWPEMFKKYGRGGFLGPRDSEIEGS